MSAKSLKRPIEEITGEEVINAVKDCDTNNDGYISRDELQEWIIPYMKKINKDYCKESIKLMNDEIAIK